MNRFVFTFFVLVSLFSIDLILGGVTSIKTATINRLHFDQGQWSIGDEISTRGYCEAKSGEEYKTNKDSADPDYCKGAHRSVL